MHTPGPWLPSKFGFQVLTGDSWNTICTIKGGAEWEDGRGGDQESNAVLIAAAPDLLEYVRSSAMAGCATAALLVARIDGIAS